MNRKVLLTICIVLLVLCVGLICIIVEDEDVDMPSIEAVSLYDESGSEISAADGWYAVTANTKIRVKFDGEVEHIFLYLTPTGTETYGLREQIGYRCAYNNDSTGEAGFGIDSGEAEFIWNVPEEGFTGHLGVELVNGTAAQYESSVVNLTNER